MDRCSAVLGKCKLLSTGNVRAAAPPRGIYSNTKLLCAFLCTEKQQLHASSPKEDLFLIPLLGISIMG